MAKCQKGLVLRDFTCGASSISVEFGTPDVEIDKRLSTYIVENNKAVGVKCAGTRVSTNFPEDQSIGAEIDCVDPNEFANSFKQTVERYSNVPSGSLKETEPPKCPNGQVRQSHDCDNTSTKFNFEEVPTSNGGFFCRAWHNGFFKWYDTTVTASQVCMHPSAEQACQRK